MFKSSLKNLWGYALSGFRNGGYTLIEMAITVTMIGVILSMIAPPVKLYLKHEAAKTTTDNASVIIGALNAYLIQHGSYPCPARMNAQRTDPDYGFSGDCTDKTVPPGKCVGYCVQPSDRQWDDNAATLVTDYPILKNWDGRVRRGTVPFRTLGLQEFQAEDGYKDRFVYVVTENLAVQGAYDRNLGGIDLVNGMNISGRSLAQSIYQNPDQCGPAAPNPVIPHDLCMGGGPINNHYYERLVSAPPAIPNVLPGSVGGSIHYLIISNGPDRAGAFSHEGQVVNPCPGTAGTLDAVNCYISNINLPPAIYRWTEYADTAGASHFDDMVKFYTSVEIPLWQVAGQTGLDMNDLVMAGDGTSGSNTGKVGINMVPDYSPTAAALQVTADVVAEKNLETGQICAPGSTTQCIQAAMTQTCPSGQVATGFTSTGQLNCIASSPPPTSCPSGQVIKGIDSTGKLICQSILSCPSRSTRMCWNSATASYYYDIIPSPAGTVGYPGDTYTTPPPPDPAAGSSYQKTFTCKLTSTGGAVWALTSTTGTCTCSTNPYTQDCYTYLGTGCSNCWSGAVTFANSCPDGTPTYQGKNCTCTNYTSTTSSPCQAGYTGTQTTSQSFTCDPSNSAAPAVAGTPTTTGACTCDPTATQTQSITCQAAGYGAGYSGTVTQTSAMNCTTSTWGPWVTTSDNCTCSPIKQTQQIGCPLPQVGTQYQSQTYDCTANAWGPWTTYSNTCGAVVHTWEMASSPTGTTGTPATIQVGQSCTNVGQTAPCSASAGSGSYYQYPVCQCQ